VRRGQEKERKSQSCVKKSACEGDLVGKQDDARGGGGKKKLTEIVGKTKTVEPGGYS